MADQKLVFLNSYSPRTGHNFAAEVLKLLGQVKLAPHARAETHLSTLLARIDEVRSRHHFETDQQFLDYVVLDGLRERLLAGCDETYVVFKDTTILGTNHLRSAFPHDLHLILLRDPEAVVASIIKATNFTKKNWKTRLKRLTTAFGIYPAWVARRLARQTLEQMPSLDAHVVIRYEDLVSRDRATLEQLKELFGCDLPVETLIDRMDKIQVINTSFFEEVGGTKIWEAKEQNSSFDPVRRKAHSWPIRLGIAWGSKPLRRALGYR